jgi:chemotaxis protein methyltransferase CheR
MSDPSASEFPLAEHDFQVIARRLKDLTGIALGGRKRQLVYSRLSRRLRELGLQSFTDYCRLLEGPQGEAECREMVNAMTTNLTAFFREPHHFAFLADALLAERGPQAWTSADRRLRIWSAGCSSGEEPYSIAMTVRRSRPDLAPPEARILATDIDTRMIAVAAAGRYDSARGAAIPACHRAFVRKLDARTVEMDDALKALIVFKALNLFEPWPMRGPFDAIFCRNVIIYFDKAAQRALVERFSRMLAPGGFLFIGHSESLFKVSDQFRHVGRTIYQRLP